MKIIMIVKIVMKRMLCGLVMPQDGRLEVLHDDNEEDIEEEEGKRKMATKIMIMTLMLIVMLMMLSNLIAINVL